MAPAPARPPSVERLLQRLRADGDTDAGHAALVAACGSPLLMGIREGLFDQAERYVALSITSG